MNKKLLNLTLAAPFLGLAIYTIFHDCQKARCFFCRYSNIITFAYGCATFAFVWKSLKE